MQDLPVVLKWHNFQILEKALTFFMESKFCKSDVYFINRHKMCRRPLITSFQCNVGLFKYVWTIRGCCMYQNYCSYLSHIKLSVCKEKAQISPGICLAWPIFTVCSGTQAFLMRTDSEDTDQSELLPKLFCSVLMTHCHIFGFLMMIRNVDVSLGTNVHHDKTMRRVNAPGLYVKSNVLMNFL